MAHEKHTANVLEAYQRGLRDYYTEKRLIPVNRIYDLMPEYLLDTGASEVFQAYTNGWNVSADIEANKALEPES